MAIIRMNFFSESLLRNINVMAILPVDKRKSDGEGLRSKDKPLKTLYMLHGLHGCELDWIAGTKIVRRAQERNLAVIMPAGENTFYNDISGIHDYMGKFTAKELVDFTRTVFPLSEKREDTYVGGNSMGGLGAIYCGFRHPEIFGKICALSSAFIGGQYPKQTQEPYDLINNSIFNKAVFGDEESYNGGQTDYKMLVKQALIQNKPIPQIYMACGQDDPLLPLGRDFRDYLKALQIPVAYYERPGKHDWEFWDNELNHVFQWLPLEK